MAFVHTEVIKRKPSCVMLLFAGLSDLFSELQSVCYTILHISAL